MKFCQIVFLSQLAFVHQSFTSVGRGSACGQASNFSMLEELSDCSGMMHSVLIAKGSGRTIKDLRIISVVSMLARQQLKTVLASPFS